MTVVLILALAVVAMAAVSAWATGTPAGTIIKNTATLDYKDVNGNAKQQLTAYVETTVLTKRGVDVTPAGYTTALTNEDKVTEYAFAVTNTGNADDTLALSVAGLDSAWTYEILWDANGNGMWDLGEETDVTTTGLLAQDTSYKVIVRVTAPATADYNGSDTVTLTATSSDGTTKDTGVVNVTVSSANVTMTKVASTAAPVPLSNFTYTITVTNSDLETAAYNVVMTDVLDSDLTWVSNAPSTGSAVESAGTVTWSIGTLPANTTATLTITVYVKEEIPQGTSITNTANLSYEDSNGNDYTDTASSDPGTASQLADVDIATTYVSPTYVDPGDFIVVPFTITNTGNGTDSYGLTDSDSGTLAMNYTFYKDADGDGILVAGVDFTDADGDGFLSQGDTILMTPITNTGDLDMNETMTFVAIASVPTTALYTDTSAVSVTATSTSDPTVYMSFTATSEVLAPVLTLVKAVDKSTAQPGETLTYTLTIQNIGDGIAYEVVLVDPVPAETTFVAGSIAVTGATTAAHDGATPGVVRVTFDTITAGATIVITFQVIVK